MISFNNGVTYHRVDELTDRFLTTRALRITNQLETSAWLRVLADFPESSIRQRLKAYFALTKRGVIVSL